MLANQCERPLLHPKRGAFLDPHFRALTMAPEGGEDGDVGIDPQRIVAPVPRRDHPPVEVEDTTEFHAVKRGNGAPLPRWGERRDDTQALFTFGCG
jgi:hypothetical protein